MLPTPGDPLLVEQERLHRRPAPARLGAQRLGGEVGAQRLDAEPRGEVLVERVAAEQHDAGAEAAHVDEQEPVCPSSSVRSARARCGRLLVLAAGTSSRLPVMRRCMTRWTSSSSDTIRYLPRRPSRSIRRPRTASATASGGAGSHQRGSSTSIALEPPALDGGRELAADRLDLGQLGHARSVLAGDRPRHDRVRRAWPAGAP